MKRISIATQRVLFLLDCTILPKEDIQLNTRSAELEGDREDRDTNI